MNRKQRKAQVARRREQQDALTTRRRIDEVAAGIGVQLEPGQLTTSMRHLGYEYVGGGWKRRPKP